MLMLVSIESTGLLVLALFVWFLVMGCFCMHRMRRMRQASLHASHAAHAAGMFACGRHVSRVGRASRGREISIVMRC